MLIPVLLFIVGLLCLIKGGDWFVDGATGIARRFHVPELLIGATVVSIGTTLPEVMVSTTSALTGHGEIAYGNAIGSVICNSALIAAITIAVRPGKVDPKSLRTPVAFFFVAAAFYAGVAYTTGSFTRPVGLILLAMFVAYIVCNVLAMKNTPAPEEEEQAEEGPFAKELGLLVIGAVLIAVGADLLVDNGTLIAQALGVPESVIALTFVALGTSLPELVTAITSLAKGHGALSRQKSIQAFCQDTFPTVPSSPSGANQRSVCAGKTRSSGTSKLWPQGRSEGCAACDELLDDGQDIVLTDNYVLHVLQGHLGAGILAGDDLIAGLHGHGDFLAVYHAAGAHGNDLSHGGLLLCGAGEDDAALGGLLGLYHFQDHTIS